MIGKNIRDLPIDISNNIFLYLQHSNAVIINKLFNCNIDECFDSNRMRKQLHNNTENNKSDFKTTVDEIWIEGRIKLCQEIWGYHHVDRLSMYFLPQPIRFIKRYEENIQSHIFDFEIGLTI